MTLRMELAVDHLRLVEVPSDAEGSHLGVVDDRDKAVQADNVNTEAVLNPRMHVCTSADSRRNACGALRLSA